MSKQTDWLTEEVLDTFAGLGFDAPYIADKRDTLAGKDRFAVLVWCNSMFKFFFSLTGTNPDKSKCFRQKTQMPHDLNHGCKALFNGLL
jgi:hypothetical protein